MGWGEPKGPSAEIVRHAERLRAADLLSRVAAAVLERSTTGLLEQLARARDAYEATKR